MNPHSPFTYYRRHKRSALLQISLISVATLGLFILVGVLDAIPLRANVSYLTKLSRIVPVSEALNPAVVSQIRTNPDVERVIPDNGLSITLPTLLGTDSQHLMGVSQVDAQTLMQHCGLRLKEGRMFEPLSKEFILSEEVARALNIQIGNEIGREVDSDYYEAISAPLVLVGILEGDPEINPGPSVRLGFISSEYLESHELDAPRITGMLVIAREGRKSAVDEFLENTIHSKYTEVETFGLLADFSQMARAAVYVIFGVVNSIVAVAVSFVVGIVNRIAITNRLDEFGLLHALGGHKKRLIRRLTLETATVAGIGWIVGLGLALLIMTWIKNTFFYDLGMELDLFNPAPFFFVMPIPVIVAVMTSSSLKRIFSSLDAVGIIDRGKLSMEESQGQPTTKQSRTKPLSSLTFFLRHRRRGVLVMLGTALMVLSITFPVFLLSTIVSAMKPYFQYLQDVSLVYPAERSELEPGIIGQIKSHSMVAYTIPSIPLSIQMVLPPGGTTDIPVFGISETDLPVLMEAFGFQLGEGRMVQAGSNEIVISSAVAVNRGFHIGDPIGGETDDGDSLIADNIPVKMEIVGILSPGLPWVGFASYEYLDAHELTSPRSRRWIIIPQEGQKQVLDNWLTGSVDSTQARIVIHADEDREYREMTTSLVLTFTVLEFMIAGVAAIALAVLNYIFFTQRKTEFGVLNAIGISRRWLKLRVMKETIGMVGIAWIMGAVLCGVGLYCMHYFFYAPRGLNLNFFSPTPWLLTLPIPLAVVAASVGTITWTLSKLDPISIIERR